MVQQTILLCKITKYSIRHTILLKQMKFTVGRVRILYQTCIKFWFEVIEFINLVHCVALYTSFKVILSQLN